MGRKRTLATLAKDQGFRDMLATALREKAAEYGDDPDMDALADDVMRQMRANHVYVPMTHRMVVRLIGDALAS